MAAGYQPFIDLARRLSVERRLEQMLQLAVDDVAELLDVERASIRLLDATGNNLIALCRAGAPLHVNALTRFAKGEGLIGWVAERLEPVLLQDAESDDRFVPRPGMRSRLTSFIGVPLVADEACMGVLSIVGERPGQFDESHLQMARLVAAICEPHVKVARIKRLAMVDPLTGALNRRGLDGALQRGERASDVDVPLVVVMVDIDDFDSVNEVHGHEVGDRVLREVALVLGQSVRAADAVVRYGGEEFLLILPGTTALQGARIADRARRAVESLRVRVERSVGPVLGVSASFGVAERLPGECNEALVARAEAALRAAKDNGKNRVTRAGPAS